jgi:hypothetical protein
MNRLLYCLSALLLGASAVLAWDYDGHRLVNQIALASLPPDFPAFVTNSEAAERIAFLSSETDRWKNTPDLSLKNCNIPDHYINLEELEAYGLKPSDLPVFRYDFVSLIASNRAANPTKFPEPNPAFNSDHTRGLVGMLPWALAENFAKLRSCFSYLKTFEECGGTPEEIANAKANIIYVMGVMGHFAGDAVQPLHTTRHHAGWIGENPNRYQTNWTIHQWIDGGYFEKTGLPHLQELKGSLRTARLVHLDDRDARPDEIFKACMRLIEDSHKQVVPLYELEKAGGFSGEGEAGRRGRPFLDRQLVSGGQFLGDLWYTAWKQASPDKYLREQLAKRKKSAEKETH